MNIKNLIRDGSKIKEALFETPTGSIVAKQDIKIHIPVRFTNRGLAEVGADNYICAICAFIIEDKYYAISNAISMFNIKPTKTMVVNVFGDDYYEFFFPKGSVVIATTDLVKKDNLLYPVMDEIISRGNVPWYMGYEDVGKMFDDAQYFTGANFGTSREVSQLIVALVSRTQEDRLESYRRSINRYEDLTTKPPVFVPLKSVIYSATSTVNKLVGSYFTDAVNSALINPSTRVEKIESLLRA